MSDPGSGVAPEPSDAAALSPIEGSPPPSYGAAGGQRLVGTRGRFAQRFGGFGAGAIAAAAGYALATICCIPVALGVLGVAMAGASAVLSPYRIYFGALAAVSLVAAFVQSYRRRCKALDACESRAGMGRLWFMALVVAALLTSSAWSSWLARPSGPRSPGIGSLRNIGSVEELKSAFNRDTGRPRLVLLLSPT